MNQPQPNSSTAVQNYTQHYTYDKVGNILKLQHVANAGSYTRDYTIDGNSNRMTATAVGSDSYSYSYDARGNMATMPQLQDMGWNALNELYTITQGTTIANYQYSSGQRVRKLVNKGSIIEERIYLGSFEIYRKFDSTGSLTLERTTVHVSDDSGRIAMLEVRTQGTDDSPKSLERYVYSNHLQSSVLELDGSAAIISYEEYHPYGTTAYQANNASINAVAKRYRYTGKERDEESGLYYHGARYYIPWLCRWTAVDALQAQYATWSSYNYGNCNPVVYNDPSGNGGELPGDTIPGYNNLVTDSQKQSGLQYALDYYRVGPNQDKQSISPTYNASLTRLESGDLNGVQVTFHSLNEEQMKKMNKEGTGDTMGFVNISLIYDMGNVFEKRPFSSETLNSETYQGILPRFTIDVYVRNDVNILTSLLELNHELNIHVIPYAEIISKYQNSQLSLSSTVSGLLVSEKKQHQMAVFDMSSIYNISNKETINGLKELDSKNLEFLGSKYVDFISINEATAVANHTINMEKNQGHVYQNINMPIDSRANQYRYMLNSYAQQINPIFFMDRNRDYSAKSNTFTIMRNSNQLFPYDYYSKTVSMEEWKQFYNLFH